MKNRKNILLNKFFSEELSENEKGEFLDIAGKDKEFVKSFIRDIEIHTAIDELYSSNSNSHKNIFWMKRVFFSRTSLIVIPVAAVLCVVLVFMFEKKTESPKQLDLFDMYYKPFELFTTRSQNSSLSTDSIFWLYSIGDFDRIYSTLGNPSHYSKMNDLSLIFSGVVCIEKNDFTKALELFELVGPDSPNYTNACWYLGLLNLKFKNYIKAQEYFIIVENNNLIYMGKARILLDSIATMGTRN